MDTATLPPLLSVIIPCHDGAKTLGAQLEALRDQIGAPQFEVIVVDNRSSDGSARLVREFDPMGAFDLRLVDAHRLQGTSYTRNCGIRAARAERLMFADADDVVSAWWIAQGIAAFEDAALWSGAAILLSDDEMSKTREEIRRAFGDSAAHEALSPPGGGAFPVIMGCNFGATRSAMRRIGGFDQSLPVIGEDNDLAFRARRAGLAVMSAPSVRIGYRGKWEPQQMRRGAFRSARAHALIASRYRAWTDSPFPHPGVILPRWLAAGARMLVRPQRRDWGGWALRGCAAAGILLGYVQYRVLGRIPPRMIGAGWLDQKGAE